MPGVQGDEFVDINFDAVDVNGGDGGGDGRVGPGRRGLRPAAGRSATMATKRSNLFIINNFYKDSNCCENTENGCLRGTLVAVCLLI